MNRLRKVALVCCSNGISSARKDETKALRNILEQNGIQVYESPYLYSESSVFSACAKDRAAVLNDFAKDRSFDAVFDISGGDLANELLPYIDYSAFQRKSAFFWGYSDLTVIINAVYTMTDEASVLYSARNLVLDHSEKQLSDFSLYNSSYSDALFQFPYRFIRGTEMSGIVVGGNIRCFLKLAGTPYFPDVTGKILLLESYGGGPAQITTYLNQLLQMGVFDRISGVILGTFTQMEQNMYCPDVQDLLLTLTGDSLPVIKTEMIGHGTDSNAIIIGKKYSFSV